MGQTVKFSSENITSPESMKLWVILLLLQLWDDVKVSISQDACTKPDIPNGFAVGSFNDSVIYYSCNENFELFAQSWWAEATCVNGVWSDLHQCIAAGKFCNQPPKVENAIIIGPNQRKYSPGSSVTYQCREKFTTKRENTITCKNGKWEQKSIVCDKYCEILTDGKLTVTTSDIKEKYLEDETINYVCKAPGVKTVELAMCVNGLWQKTVNCPALPCQVGVLPPGLGISGTRPTNPVNSKQKLNLFCGDEYDLEGSAETECLETGQWSPPFPTCSKKCKVLQLPENVIITRPTGSVSRSKGEKITFGCRQREHYINGIETIECLGNGKWSSQPPKCGGPKGCGRPPPLIDGDTEGFTKSSYENGETVRYICASRYTMEGGSTMTCNNGAWTGTIRCMKPCTVTEEMMNVRNIQFARFDQDKLYAPHRDLLTFACKPRTRQVGSGSMRRQCIDGEMELPTCQ